MNGPTLSPADLLAGFHAAQAAFAASRKVRDAWATALSSALTGFQIGDRITLPRESHSGAGKRAVIEAMNFNPDESCVWVHCVAIIASTGKPATIGGKHSFTLCVKDRLKTI